MTGAAERGACEEAMYNLTRNEVDAMELEMELGETTGEYGEFDSEGEDPYGELELADEAAF